MKTSSIWLAAVLFVSACGVGVSEVEGQDTLDTDNAELGTASRSYVIAQRDYRKCAYPMCSGWYVTDVNRAHPKTVYVYALDFSASGLDEVSAMKAQGSGTVLLRGKLGPKFMDYPSFVVSDAWLGMPGIESGTDFYVVSKVNVQCIKAPCPTLKATKLNAGGSTMVDGLSVKAAALPRVDANWLASRVTEKGAIVTATVTKGQLVSGTYEKILSASQVFVKVPEAPGPCPLAKMPACTGGKVRTYARDLNRCVLPGACVNPGACAAVVPQCAEGYSLVSWTGGMFACTQYACDPTFSVVEEQ